ncbi:hypothetical protein HRbin30_02839 [bacterium HR30]|nr:hypothetical protein HRbin30_02839 [bacterium HR30]
MASVSATKSQIRAKATQSCGGLVEATAIQTAGTMAIIAASVTSVARVAGDTHSRITQTKARMPPRHISLTRKTGCTSGSKLLATPAFTGADSLFIAAVLQGKSQLFLCVRARRVSLRHRELLGCRRIYLDDGGAYGPTAALLGRVRG